MAERRTMVVVGGSTNLRPPEAMLRAVDARRRRWIWIHAWMIVGTIVSVLAVVSMSRLLCDEGRCLLAIVGATAFIVGSLAFLVTLVLRLTATPSAAADTVRAGAVPQAYRSQARFMGVLHTVYMLLSYSTFSVLGGSMLGSASFPAWLGWTGVATGVVCVAGYLITRGGPFAPPIIAHSFGLLAGVVLLASA